VKAAVYNNQVLAGILEKDEKGRYVFTYTEAYHQDPGYPPISLTLLKQRDPFRSDQLFPFFCGLLSEGVNKDIQCRLLKIDEEDDFTRLLATATEDTIGAITIKKIDS
jgi:HipA-like protein